MIYLQGYAQTIRQIPFYFKNEKKTSPLQNISTLTQLQEKIVSSFNLETFKACKQDIQKILKNHSNNPLQIETFIAKILEWGIQKGYSSIDDEISALFDDRAFFELIRKNPLRDVSIQNVAKKTLSAYAFFPKPVSLSEKLKQGLISIIVILMNPFPNLLNMASEVISLINNQKKFTTLWEKYLLLEIAYKFFLVPHFLVKFLKPIFIVPAKVYLAATLVFFAGCLTATLYQRWFRTVPTEIVNCRNLDQDYQKGVIQPKVGQSLAIQKIVTALLSNSNILLIAKSGEGKTGLVNRLVQLKNEKKLPKELTNLSFFSLHCGDLLGHGSFDHAEMIIQTKDRIEGLEDKLLFFFDELDQLTSNEAFFQTFKQRFLSEDEASPKVIAATTTEGYKKILAKDKDGSFMQRVLPIELESASDLQCRLVIEEMLRRKAGDLPFTQKAIEQVLKLSQKREGEYDYLPHVGRLAKVKKIMGSVIGRCQYAYNPDYISDKMAVARDSNTDLVNNENELRTLKKEAQHIYSINKNKLQHEKEHVEMAAKIAQGVNRVDMNKAYLLREYFVFNALNAVMRKEIDALKDKMDIEINEQLVDSVYKNLVESQKKLDLLQG